MSRGRLNLWLRAEMSGPVVRALEPVLYLAAFVWRRLLWRTTFVGITGSASKTTTKECVAAVLARHGRTFRTFRNQNNSRMVALNLLRVRPWHRYAVIEVAGALPDMAKSSARLLRPDVAVVLNVLRTHTAAFPDLDAYAAGKASLVAAVAPGGLAVLNVDDDRVAKMPAQPGVRVTRFGIGPAAEFRIADARGAWPARFTFTLHHGDGAWPVATQLVGTQWVTAAGAVMAVAISLGMDPAVAAAALSDVPPFAARMNPVELPSGAVLLRDDYGVSIDTIEPALSVLDEATATRKLLVMTDFSDSGLDTRRRLKYLGRRAGEVADCVVFIGECGDYGARRAVDAGMAAGNAHSFESLKHAAEFLRTELRAGDLVLLAGRTSDHVSRVFFAQLGTVACWKQPCNKHMLCDICWELGFTPDDQRKRTR
jgi:UDP-N-acetylmuramoyl-tripeptide--D-alanyl-D-alanine ligase